MYKHVIEELKVKNIIDIPDFVVDNIVFLCIGGSYSYMINQDNSDVDIIGVFVPPKEMIFTEIFQGTIDGYDKPKNRYNQWQKHHINYNGKSYDITIYNIVDFFKLLTDNNPNMLDYLFSPEHCLLYSTDISSYFRKIKKEFLSKHAYFKFSGYLISQRKEMAKKNIENPARKLLIEKFGYDTKYGSHSVRVGLEILDILTLHDLDVTKFKDELIRIRRGLVLEEDLNKRIDEIEVLIKKAYENCTLPEQVDTLNMKKHLLKCLEIKYGNLDFLNRNLL